MDHAQLRDAPVADHDQPIVHPSSRPAPHPQPTVVVCPYCGHESGNSVRCDRCRGLLDPLSRQASQNAMGPWFIRDDAAPFRPGCSYDTLRALIARGRVTRESIIRGPSTRQFWARASSIPGVAHLLGECHVCHGVVDPDAATCPACGVSFACSQERQLLGLAPVRLLPGHAAPEEIARSMVESLRAGPARPAEKPHEAPPIAATRSSTEFDTEPTPFPRRSKHPKPVILVSVVVVVVLVALGLFTSWLIAPDLVTAAIQRLISRTGH